MSQRPPAPKQLQPHDYGYFCGLHDVHHTNATDTYSRRDILDWLAGHRAGQAELYRRLLEREIPADVSTPSLAYAELLRECDRMERAKRKPAARARPQLRVMKVGA